MKVYVYQLVKCLKCCDILRHGFYNVLIYKGLNCAFCDIKCRKVATFYVAKCTMYLIEFHLFIKSLSQNVATKNGFNYMNSS